ncbi:MAG: CvpA family protein [Armatimonadota bacterium]|nr:CvpA family protein [Armatimonadota bacterium]MDR7532924.1 CvpA family protein [Armatimonadota bacterium]MDR7536131.1 CvpA family protein [Armatimonadota bacterium]
MTYLDWIVVALALWFVLQGLLKGAATAAFGALAVLVAYVGACLLVPAVVDPVARALMGLVRDLPRDWARTSAFAVTFLVGYVLLLVLVSIVGGAARPETTGQVLGAFVGLIKAAAWGMALVGLFLASPFGEAGARDVERSVLARPLAQAQRVTIEALRDRSPVPLTPVGAGHRL